MAQMSLAERLKKARVAAGYETAKEAAVKFHWNEGSYRACEAGRRQPSRKMSMAYAKALDVDLTWLLSGMGAPTSEPTRPEVQQVPIYRLGALKKWKALLTSTEHRADGAPVGSSLMHAMLAAAVAEGVDVFPVEEKLAPNAFV